MLNDPHLEFVKICQKNNIPVLGIFNRARDNLLNLKGYLLNDSLAKAFLELCRRHPRFINSIILENNGLRDQSTALMVSAMDQLKSLQKIVIKNNVVGPLSLKSLQQVLSRQQGLLVELRIAKVRLSKETTEGILSSILENNTLKKLSMV